MENHKWRIWNFTNKESGKPQMKKKMNIHKIQWTKWKTENEEIENPQTNELKFHRLIKWNFTNEESENPQMKRMKNHKWKNKIP